jgi:uncharacterized DUF497 family protein
MSIVMEKIFEQVLREVEEDSQERYEDSDKACFEKESGDPDEYVIVNDDLFTFKWRRGKSNENVNDTGTGKRGFSFYFARYVFYDKYSYDDETLATNNNYTGHFGIIPGDEKEEKFIVINTIEEDSNILIISAYYADDPKYQKYIERYNRQKKRMQKYEEARLKTPLSKEILLHLQKLIE